MSKHPHVAGVVLDLSRDEIELIIEALLARASHHDSMSRANPRGAGPHDRASRAMRKLAGTLTLEIGGTI